MIFLQGGPKFEVTSLNKGLFFSHGFLAFDVDN